MKTVKDDSVYLGHIQDCIAKIEAYTKDGKQAFMKDTMIQDAVMRNLEIIGEAANNVSAQFREAHSDVGWRRAIALRNALIHNYMGLNLARVWSDVTDTVPKLKRQVAEVSAALEKPSE